MKRLPIMQLVWWSVSMTSCLAAVNPVSSDFWVMDSTGRISHTFNGDGSAVLCMQGRKTLVQVEADRVDGVFYTVRFFNVRRDKPHHERIEFEVGAELTPQVRVNDQPLRNEGPLKATFDGVLTVTYPKTGGVITMRTVYPSMTKAMVIEEWQVINAGGKVMTVSVAPGRKEEREHGGIAVEWSCQGGKCVSLRPGAAFSFFACVEARPDGEREMAVDVVAERSGRRAMAKAAWRGPGRLETPDPQLDLAFALQKFHVLEDPVETYKGVITHNGSLTYAPGIWANDSAEYSSAVYPFFGDPELNRACMNMYRVWQDYCTKNGIVPFPGSFEGPALELVQRERGDDAMVLYGLSMFLLFQGNRAAAQELWPLIEFSAASVLKHTTAEGIVASATDEMEGRYPTGEANLATSALAYGGYRHAARLARALGKTAGTEFDRRADALRKAIDRHFGAEVEGFRTYRYYKENTTLRGWILMPLAMGITNRQEGTIAALLSDKLWPGRMKGGNILAESGRRRSVWGRETYYALRVLFNAGRTEEALDLTRRVVKAQVFGENGPYPDEDAIDMQCPASLYPRVFTEGMFGIVPTGFDSFECTPWLPRDWPRMALRDVRAFGRAWDLVVEREGNQQKVAVTCAGTMVMSGVGPAGKTYAVSFAGRTSSR